jgi:hypothetical protein
MDSNQCVARTMTHQEDDEEQQRDERRAEETFCNALGDIGREKGPYYLSFTPITAEAKLSMSGLECHLCHLFGRQLISAAVTHRTRWHPGTEDAIDPGR